jgi:acetylornithine deacetylase/succinyl-diaminopimelate desuccinylase-like protein
MPDSCEMVVQESQMTVLNNALDYAKRHRARFVSELMALIRFPTVSSGAEHTNDLKVCAQWLATHLQRIGLEHIRVIPTERHPLVCAEWRRTPNRPTVLVYGHYDVQPADPLDEWEFPPFEPTVRADILYGRGACDDKGQFFIHVKALESYLSTTGTLPVNVKCLFEGEEEVGSPHLTSFIERNQRALAAQLAVISDTSMLGANRPALTYSLRGQLGVEIEVQGPKHDLHSGKCGGAVHNPLQALCEIIAKLHDNNRRVAIPGFYDRVRGLSEMEREYMRRNGPQDRKILQDAETETDWGELGYSLYERVTVRPSLSINGISGGYEGVGSKAVIPSRAQAKLSFRLVADQEPREIEILFRRHIGGITPPTVKSIVRTGQSSRPVVIDRCHPVLRAAAVAYRKAFGTRPVFLRSGGSIPVVDTFQELLGIPTILMGFGLPDDRIHAPNEKFHLENFYNGIATSIWFLAEIGARRKLSAEWVQEQVDRSERSPLL